MSGSVCLQNDFQVSPGPTAVQGAASQCQEAQLLHLAAGTPSWTCHRGAKWMVGGVLLSKP